MKRSRDEPCRGSRVLAHSEVSSTWVLDPGSSFEWILGPRRSLWPAPQKGHIRHPARPVRSRINFIQAPSKEKPRGWFVYGNSLEENAAIWRFTFYNEWPTSQPKCRKGNVMVNQWETLSKKALTVKLFIAEWLVVNPSLDSLFTVSPSNLGPPRQCYQSLISFQNSWFLVIG